MQQQKYQEALQVFEQARQRFPNRPQGYNRAAKACMALGDYKQAEHICQTGIQHCPQDITLLISLADCFLQQGRRQEAFSLFEHARQQFPNSPQGYSLAAKAYLNMGDFEQVEQLCRLGIQNCTLSAELFVVLGTCFLRQQKYQEAVLLLEQMRQQFPNRPQGYSLAAKACMAQKDYAQAERLCWLGIQNCPQAVAPRLTLAEYFLSQKDVTSAAAEFEQICKLFPDNINGYTRATQIYMTQKNYVKAEEICRTGIQNCPQDASLICTYAKILYHKDGAQKAYSYLAESLKKFPSDISITTAMLELAPYLEKDVLPTINAPEKFNDINGATVIFHRTMADSTDKIDEILQQHNFNQDIYDKLKLVLNKKAKAYEEISNYNVTFLSLGTQCGTSRFLSQWGLTARKGNFTDRLPFDLGRHPLPSVIQILQNDFQDYADNQYIEKKEYFTHTKYNIIFNHDNILDYTDSREFCSVLEKRVAAFHDCINTPTFLLCINGQKLTEPQIEAFLNCDLLRKKHITMLYVYKNGATSSENITYEEHGALFLLGISFPENYTKSLQLLFTDTKQIFIHDSLLKNQFKILDTIIDIVKKRFSKATEKRTKTADVLDSYYQEVFHNIKMQHFIDNIKKEIGASHNNGCIVMNCNPFTNGHLHLIEYAAQQVDKLIIFVVEEDLSFFKFKDRIELVKNGTKHIGNVVVVPSGKFIISTTTFPEYFFKDNPDVGTVDAANDILLFAKHIAPALNITTRFVGEEPFCKVTNSYNSQMRTILPQHNISFREIPRHTYGGSAISASAVRRFLKNNDFDSIKKIVPEATYLFLKKNYQNHQE